MRTKRKPYTARSISGAEQRVRNLEKVIAKYEEICERLMRESNLLAKLAADGQAFSNVIEKMEASKVRDHLLKRLGLNPDGSPLGS